MDASKNLNLSLDLSFELVLATLFIHSELRLINQRLAKAEVLLEQLRRCHLLHYSYTSTSTEDERMPPQTPPSLNTEKPPS